MARERRSSVRIPIKMWVEETTPEGVYFQHAGNLSHGGLFLEQTIPQAPGTIVELQFTLPGESEPIAVRGEIVAPPEQDPEELGMHVRFVGLPDAIAERIDAFVHKRQSDSK